MKRIFTLLLLASAFVCDGQNASLVKNINPTTVDVASHSDPARHNDPAYPDTGFLVNGSFIFPAFNYNGIELWKTNGTAAGTGIIRDLVSYGAESDANPLFITPVGSDIYFFTADWDYNNQNYNNYRLRKYSTTTGKIDDAVFTNLDAVSNVVTADGKIFFIGSESTNTPNPSLFMYTPGSYNYTVLDEFHEPHELKAIGDYIVYDGDDGGHGRELWLYDIPNDNSYEALDLNPNGDANPHDFIGYDNKIYFTADGGNGLGQQLQWFDPSNGTNSSVYAGFAYANPAYKIVYGGSLYFRTTSGSNYPVYSYDAGSGNVSFVADDYHAGNGPMKIADNTLFFAADDGNDGNELWKTDGSNTQEVDDINGGGDSNPRDLTVLGNKLVFVADDGSNWGLYFANNATSGNITGIQSPDYQDPIKIIGASGTQVFLYADDGTHGKELWQTDGSTASLLSDINPGSRYNYSIGSDIAGFDTLSNQAYFGATNGSTYDLYKSDGTAAGTVVAVTGSTAGFDHTYYGSDQVKTVGQTIFFAASDPTHGMELWKTNGTQGGTSFIKDINPGTDWSYPNQMTAGKTLLYFLANDGTNGTELWRSDGTAGGTFLLKDIFPGNGNPDISNMVVIGDSLYFRANDGTHGDELWVSDGTAAGTVLLKDIEPGANSSNIQGIKAINGKIWFQATTSANGAEPWTSDGTPAGTQLFKDIIPGTVGSNASDFTGLGSYIYMAADSINGQQHALWRTDGTAANTHFFFQGPNGPLYPFNFTNIGNKIAFIGYFHLWVTDGTVAGTQELSTFGQYGPAYFFISNFLAYKNHWFLYVDDQEHGMELWQTDGTAAGTFLNDVATGPLSSYPYNMIGVNNSLLFAAYDATTTGYELRRIPVSSSVSWVSFTATKQDSTHALLQWKTASETNNRGFIIQHSRDNITFDSSGFVPAGSPNGATYSFVDTIYSGPNYYRLRQIDNAGMSSYSNTEYLLRYAPLNGGRIKKSDTLCFGQVPTTMTDSVPVSGGQSFYTYQWQDSTATTTWANISGATSASYGFTSALNLTHYYRRRVTSNADSAFSNVLVKMYPAVPDTSLAVDTAWRVYAYSGNSVFLGGTVGTGLTNVTGPPPSAIQYYGYYTDTALAVNTENRWTVNRNPSIASDYVGCPLGDDQFTIAMKRKGFAAGNYAINLTRHDDGVLILKNSTVIYQQPFNQNYYADSTISLGAVMATDKIEVRLAENYGDAVLQFNLYRAELHPGIISYDQNICYNTAPYQLQNVQVAFGGPNPTQITYQWQDSTAGGSWQNISGATNNTYAPPVLTTTHYYRRAAGDGQSAVVYSNTVTVVVQPPITTTPVITQQGRVLSMNAVAGAYDYKWFRNGVQVATGLTYTALQAGTYTAKYNFACGDGPASNAITFAADAVSQTINFPAISGTSYSPGAIIRLQASATSGLPVRYQLLSGNGTISGDTLYINAAGTFIVQATQPGSNTYAPAQPVNQSFTVTQAAQTISFVAIPNKKTGDAPFTVSATSSAGLPVSYSVASGPAYVYGNQVTITGAGTITITASQSGDGNYNAAADVSQSFCVGVSSLGSISGATNVCPVTFKYAVPKITGALYQWSLSGGGILTQNADSAIVQWQTPGNYTLSVKGYSTCDTVRSVASTLSITVQSVVVPGPVSNMLPANGATGQQLPLTLSWIPGSNNVSYDLYVWDSAAAMPSTPYAAGITAVNYTLPQNSFPYNRAYKWRIVSYSGCSMISGPIQTFRLIPLPDLLITSVQAPATAFSGQPIAINWQVKNGGPGRTTLNQNWSDAVFLSFDSMPNFTIPPQTNPAAWNQLDFPIKPLLLGTVANVSALDSGQVYNSSLNFTLPARYNFPVYVYVITNYAPGNAAPLEVTYANDTAHASSPIAITLSPAPDLRVDSLVTPATTFSGSTIGIRYKTKNYGATTLAGNGWADKVYLSLSPFFDPTNAILLRAPKANGTYYYNAPEATFYNGLQLQQDSAYTKTVQVVIPNFIFGTYFIYVQTDANNTVYEGSLENNNNAGSQVQIFLTPTPVLTVSSLTLPGTSLSTTQPIGVNWNITNTGSNDNIEKNKGHYVKVLGYCGTCYQPPCGIITYSDGHQEPYCPPAQPGYRIADSLGFGASHWTDKVYLSTDSTGLDVNNALLLGSYIQGNYNPPDYDYPGNLPFYQYFGSGVPASAGVPASVNTYPVLRNGGTYSGGLGFTVPSNLPQGAYYLYVLTNADDAVYEYPNQMQTRRSGLLTINRPDLSVPTLTAPSSAASGQTITLAYTVQNGGPGGVFIQARKDYIYRSTSPTFDASAVLIASPTFTESVPANGSVQHQVNYQLPYSASGTYYFYVFTNQDSTFKENNYANNISAAASISITLTPPPNLTVSNITIPATVPAATGFPVKYTVPNNGSTATNGSWTDSIFISCSNTYSQATAYYVGRRTHNENIAPGSSYTDSFGLVIPYAFAINSCFAQGTTSQGYFFVKTNADGSLYESSSSDNVTGTGLITIINPLPDLIVSSVSNATTATAGRYFPVTWTDKNIGLNPGTQYFNGWYEGFFFSTDTVLDANDAFAGNYYVNTPLNNNQSVMNTTSSLTVPNLPAGDYYLLVKANYNNVIQYGEVNANNNVNVLRNGSNVPQKVTVTAPLLPDLTDTILTAPMSVATGQPLPLRFRVNNSGPGITYPSTWSDDVWLSNDFVPGNSSSDVYLGAFNHSGALASGGSYIDSLMIPISQTVPQGNYILIVRTNVSGYPYETTLTNNLAFQYITVYRPAPSDLIVSSISQRDTVLLGYPDTTTYVLQNLSANNTIGVETDGIYLSKSTVADSTATLLGIKQNTLNLSGLEKDTLTAAPLALGVTEGLYNVLVKTDILNNIVETDKTNNTGVAVKQIYVKVKELPLGVLTADQLVPTGRYYKLIIPDSLNGATILLTLKSADSLTANNRMYVGLGYIPSAARFDYAFGTPNSGNQQILMPSVVDSVYYITVDNANNRPAQNITLLAQRLPFAIISANTNHGGNSGNVTTKLTGSLFTSNMTASLKRGSTTVTATAVYYVNTTVVYATFPLQGATLGQYDVVLTKPDTSTATLTNGFTVEAPNNGGLITGTGVNTGQTGSGNAPGCAPGTPSGLNAQLQTEIVLPPKVFAGFPFTIQLHYSNPTNVDIPVQTRVLYSLDGLPLSLNQATVDAGTTSLYIEFTGQGGPPNIIPAGASGTINVYSKAPANYPGHKLANYILK